MLLEILQKLKEPIGIVDSQYVAYAIVFLLLISLLSLLYAPVLMPASYDWILHTTSESGAQGISGAWLARLGFLLFGLAVLWISLSSRYKWGRFALIMHCGFAVCMIGNAVFSSRPWLATMPFDLIEDVLHSWMSDLVGTAFSMGVLAILFQRQKTERLSIAIDLIALVTAIVISIAMFLWSGIDGLIQRIMFAVAYLWYVRAAWSISNKTN